MTTCAICNNSKFGRYPYNNHNRSIKRLLKYYIVLSLYPILKLKIFKSNYYVKNLCNWVEEYPLFSLFFTIRRCKECGYGIYDRRLDVKSLYKYFNDKYLPHPFAISPNDYHKKSLYLEDIRAIGQYNFVQEQLQSFSKINMLEIGAGAALFSRLVKEKHPGQITINVVEANDFWVPYYKELDIKLVSKFFPESEINQKFHYIHVSFCLEYIYDLFNAIFRLKNMLTEDGILFIAVPNCNSDWYLLDLVDTPRISFFTMKSLTNLMENFHFKVLFLQEYGLTHNEENMKQNPTYKLDNKILASANASIKESISRDGGNCLRGLFSLR